MLNFGNKEFRNLQEQVAENMKNISDLQDLSIVGINVKYIEPTKAALDEVEDMEAGDMAAVGSSAPFTLYVYYDNAWVSFGEFPKTGPMGPTGPQGEQGPRGYKGDTGDIGPRGYTGATGPQGPRGYKGDKGDKGDTGPAGPGGATLRVGTTTTGEPGSQASVTNSGTETDAVFNFTIPQGPTGAQGPIGPIGPEGPTGEMGPTGEQGVAAGFGSPTSTVDVGLVTNVSVTASGPDTAKVFDFGFTFPQLEVSTPLYTSSGVGTIRGLSLGGYDYNFAHDWSDISNKPTIQSVSGTNDGTNWTSITIDQNTYGIPSVSGTNDGTNWTTITIGQNTFAIPSGKEIVYIDTTATATDVASILTAGQWPVLKYLRTSQESTFTYILPLTYESPYAYSFSSGNYSITYSAYWATLNKTTSVWSTGEFDPVPITRTINGNTLATNITLTPSDIGVSGANNGTNWTSITIGSDTYAIPQGGGGSVSIDNKTIVQNSLTQLETAAGGWKETGEGTPVLSSQCYWQSTQ